MGVRWDIMTAEAWAATGRKWRKAIVAVEMARMSAPYVGAALLLGAVGVLGRWVWLHWLVPAFTSSPATVPSAPAVADASVGAVPGWLWAALLGLVIAGGFLFRPGRIVYRAHRRVIEVACLVMLFSGWLGVSLFTITH